MTEMDIELTSITEYFSVDIPENDLVITAVYMEDENSMTAEWDFEVIDGEPEDFTDELKDEVKEKVLKKV